MKFDVTTILFTEIPMHSVLAVVQKEFGDAEVETLLERLTSWSLEDLTINMRAKGILFGTRKYPKRIQDMKRPLSHDDLMVNETTYIMEI